jgi:hypothetical protein
MCAQIVKAFLATVLATVFAIPTAFAQAQHPIANPKAEVVAGQARFTVLAPGLIRMEWAQSGHFQDHASLTFIDRDLPVPHYSTARKTAGS